MSGSVLVQLYLHSPQQRQRNPQDHKIGTIEMSVTRKEMPRVTWGKRTSHLSLQVLNSSECSMHSHLVVLFSIIVFFLN